MQVMKKKVEEDANFFFRHIFNFLYDIHTGDKMKKILKGIFVPVFMAILVGFVGGRFVYKTYRDNLYDRFSSSRLYLIEKGEYDSIDLMREENSGNNYVYYN